MKQLKPLKESSTKSNVKNISTGRKALPPKPRKITK